MRHKITGLRRSATASRKQGQHAPNSVGRRKHYGRRSASFCKQLRYYGAPPYLRRTRTASIGGVTAEVSDLRALKEQAA